MEDYGFYRNLYNLGNKYFSLCNPVEQGLRLVAKTYSTKKEKTRLVYSCTPSSEEE